MSSSIVQNNTTTTVHNHNQNLIFQWIPPVRNGHTTSVCSSCSQPRSQDPGLSGDGYGEGQAANRPFTQSDEENLTSIPSHSQMKWLICQSVIPGYSCAYTKLQVGLPMVLIFSIYFLLMFSELPSSAVDETAQAIFLSYQKSGLKGNKRTGFVPNVSFPRGVKESLPFLRNWERMLKEKKVANVEDLRLTDEEVLSYLYL